MQHDHAMSTMMFSKKGSAEISKLIVRPLRVNEIPRAVAIHESAFPNFFLTFLGPGFLSLLYRFYIKGDTETALAVILKGQVVGTVLGTTEPKGFYRRLATRYSPLFALAALKSFCRKPSILPRLVRALFYRGDAPYFSGDAALLASICVDPAVQNAGIGRKLVDSFETEVSKRGINFVYLSTDRHNNEKICSFYEKLGWTVESEFMTPEGRVMSVYGKFLGRG